MKWITREKVKVDRVACPWLIKKFVDKDAEFVFVPGDKVMAEAKRLDAIPYDVKDVELGHHGKECSFEAIVKKYQLTGDPALVLLGGSSTAPTPTTHFTISRREPASKPSPKVFGTSASRTTMRTMRRSGSSTTRSMRIAARWSSAASRTATLWTDDRSRRASGSIEIFNKEISGEDMNSQKVAFVCLHGSAKSLIAAEYFNRLATERNLALRATTSGPEPDGEVPQNVVAGMKSRGIDVSQYRPTLIAAEQLADASLIVSFACDAGGGLRPPSPRSVGMSAPRSATISTSPGPSLPAASRTWSRVSRQNKDFRKGNWSISEDRNGGMRGSHGAIRHPCT